MDVEAHVLNMRGPNRKVLDEWFPTVVRYVGIAMLIYELVVDQGRNPAIITAAMGMILFKTVYGNGSKSE